VASAGKQPEQNSFGGFREDVPAGAFFGVSIYERQKMKRWIKRKIALCIFLPAMFLGFIFTYWYHSWLAGRIWASKFIRSL